MTHNTPRISHEQTIHATRLAVARGAAAQLAAAAGLNRIRLRSLRTWESCTVGAMPQAAWLASSEEDLTAWLNAGGFASGNELPPSGVGYPTKTAA
ncbi:hypothetical protein [Pseudoduganella chitinolytica]|uniref:Helix-turn-helix domain-containing protein n=1 Tax=Pseudoduganella chitinolytica TaxID=34070 RepID=A0ABY8BBT4_9BURK|nr:hypothetical protein [Pseudoduganella chitinolytica]WEF33176.1 hypothetical protein PX653_27960 [Pseudoduganella chitinolytica]